MAAASFLGLLFVFLVLGLYSATKSRGTKADYYLASQDVAPWLVGLSAIATANSGYMFIGVIGFTYAVGLSAVWLMVGWIAGDLIASFVIHRQLRVYTERTSEATFAGVLSRWEGRDFRVLRRVAALLTLAFLGAYAAAQLSAGGKALHAIFGWSHQSGALMVAGAVALYCLAGGIRASIWTDVAQSLVMMVAMALLLVVAIVGLGGPAASIDQLAAIPHYLDLFPRNLIFPGALGIGLFVMGWLFAGFSVIGQPHIMVRFMALDDVSNLMRARVYYYSYYTIFYLLATGVGLMSRLYLPELNSLDPELALPTIANNLLPPVLVGLVLAGIFAATMSTADSLVLSCSSAITHDLAPRRLEKPWEIRGATLLITAFALAIALAETQSVFSLVILAWSTLASAFGPLLFLYVRGHRISEPLSLTIVSVGVLVALGWRAAGLQADIYEGMPGMLAGIATYYVAKMFAGLSSQPSARTQIDSPSDP